MKEHPDYRQQIFSRSSTPPFYIQTIDSPSHKTPAQLFLARTYLPLAINSVRSLDFQITAIRTYSVSGIACGFNMAPLPIRKAVARAVNYISRRTQMGRARLLKVADRCVESVTIRWKGEQEDISTRSYMGHY